MSSRRLVRRATAGVLTPVLLCIAPAWADEPGEGETAEGSGPSRSVPAADLEPADTAPNAWANGAAKAFDVLPIRLLSATAVAIGFGSFVVSVPLVAPGFQMEGIRNSWDYFVMGPYEYTFVRPLGDF